MKRIAQTLAIAGLILLTACSQPTLIIPPEPTKVPNVDTRSIAAFVVEMYAQDCEVFWQSGAGFSSNQAAREAGDAHLARVSETPGYFSGSSYVSRDRGKLPKFRGKWDLTLVWIICRGQQARPGADR